MTGTRPRPATAASAAPLPAALPVDESREFIRSRLVLGLRDAHAATLQRQDLLRRICHAAMDPALCQLALQLQGEAEEQQRRLEHVFATLRECPAGGQASELPAALKAALSGSSRTAMPDSTMAELARRMMRRDVLDVKALRLMASAGGQHLAARLLGDTAQELCAAAEALANLPRQLRGAAVH